MAPDRKDPTLRITLLPRDTNRLGTIFGGIILSYIDLAGAIEARESTGPLNFVTVAMDRVEFMAPVFVGDVVSFYTRTVKTGRTSVTVDVEVEARRVKDRQMVPVTAARVVFVSVDENRRPLAIKQTPS
jgi:acyl-CoA thioesterase YciA